MQPSDDRSPALLRLMQDIRRHQDGVSGPIVPATDVLVSQPDHTHPLLWGTLRHAPLCSVVG